MSISVVLIAYHADKWLKPCLDSLAVASNTRLHLILVDNSGNTIIDDLDLTKFDTEIIKTEKPLGFAEANNYALTVCSYLHQNVLFLNQDTISHPGWIDTCVACLQEEPLIGAISPLILNYDATNWDPSFLDCMDTDALPRLEQKASNLASWVFSENAPAPCLIVRKEVLKVTGPFDPIYGSYYEDYDLCMRIKEKGYKIAFCTGALLNHFSGSSTNTREKELKRMKQIIRNKTIYKIRNSESSRPLVFLSFLLIEFPRRLLRGFLNTASSQPPIIVFKAYLDLLKLSGRLAFSHKDKKAWDSFLLNMGWPHKINGFN